MKIFPVVAVAFMLQQQQPAQPPALLAAALKTLPGVRLLVPADDLREYTQQELQKFGFWPPWLVQDLDRDGRSDVVAVVVKPSPAGTTFGVIAVHEREPEAIQWIIDLDVDGINGVAKGKAADVVVPLFCVECDSNLWFRWSGEEYEANLHAVGEEIEVGSETQEDLPLYTSANAASKLVVAVPHCTTVVVRKIGGTPEKRWYFVETPEGQRGWVPDSVTSSDVCVG